MDGAGWPGGKAPEGGNEAGSRLRRPSHGAATGRTRSAMGSGAARSSAGAGRGGHGGLRRRPGAGPTSAPRPALVVEVAQPFLNTQVVIDRMP